MDHHWRAPYGIRVGSAAAQGSIVAGNLVFASTAISGSIDDRRDNITDTVTNAGGYVASPSTTLQDADFYPLEGTCQGTPLDMTAFAGDHDDDLDFDGASKGAFTYRGAYAGSGSHAGWALGATVKGYHAAPPDASAGGGRDDDGVQARLDGGVTTTRVDGRATAGDAGSDAPAVVPDAGPAASAQGERSAAGGCATSPHAGVGGLEAVWLVLLALAAVARGGLLVVSSRWRWSFGWRRAGDRGETLPADPQRRGRGHGRRARDHEGVL